MLLAQFMRARWKAKHAKKKSKVGHGKASAFGFLSPATFSVLAYTPQFFLSWPVQCAPALVNMMHNALLCCIVRFLSSAIA